MVLFDREHVVSKVVYDCARLASAKKIGNSNRMTT
jgi:hypothetical protein